jgi:hydrogenase maturation protein HypF
MASSSSRFLIRVYGIVQGVGFRPFIYRLATEAGLAGTVRNTSGCVEIDVEGQCKQIDAFIGEIKKQVPPAARIEKIITEELIPVGVKGFTILSSQPRDDEYQLLSPDLATCPACTAEISNPSDRRFHYPFTNCTNCGPRFTIIQDIPYDRPRTTMSRFKMCPDCQREYDDPLNRRFHAQPNACPVCGPQLELVASNGDGIKCQDPLTEAARLLKAGNIVAIKGLGGYLLACDATSETAVSRLRLKKKRPAKPFAIMVPEMEWAKDLCYVSDAEARLLLSPESPIVLLKMKTAAGLAPAVAPGLKYLGVMLPYTPLHHLLLAETGLPLVMTSGNLSEEPIARDNDEALSRLGAIADYLLMHNRDIYVTYDDSVVMQVDDAAMVVRRARGYAPSPIRLGFTTRPIMAAGAEMKGSFCLTRDNYAFVSQHIGDMENTETMLHYENTLRIYRQLFRIEPEIIACDMHPDYLSAVYARELAAANPHLSLVNVQHHQAHIASVMAEHGIAEPVIGVAFDGTGYGTDGTIWGGEFLLVSPKKCERLAHLEYVPLPGGDAAIRNPYRIALSYLYYLLGRQSLDDRLPLVRDTDETELNLLTQQIDRRFNSSLTSSCGRLFDAVAALIGVRRSVSYEAQAAMELETLAVDVPFSGRLYPFDFCGSETLGIIKLDRLIGAILEDIYGGVTQAEIACRFHRSMASMIGHVCFRLSERADINTIALSGGVFQNRLLLHLTRQQLELYGLKVLYNRQVPANDGGIALGQAFVAHFSMQE